MHSLRISRSSRIRFESEIGFLSGSAKGFELTQLNETVGTYQDVMTDEFVSLEHVGIQDVFDLTEPRTSPSSLMALWFTIVASTCSLTTRPETWLRSTSCASVSLMKTGVTVFDVEAFKKANEIIITAMGDHCRELCLPNPSD